MRFPIRPAAGWPTTVGGRLSVAFAAAFVVMFAWVMLREPLVRLVTGRDSDGLLDAWVAPLAMVALADAAAVSGVVARPA